MAPLFQLFEFSYPDGLLFYDRSGALSRRLQEAIPGLALKGAAVDQRDLVAPAEDLELFFGVALARIHTVSPAQQGFPATAASFFQIVTEVLELTQLKQFHFRLVLGRACGSDHEAEQLIWPLVPDATGAKLQSLPTPRRWRALQGEFLVGNLACQSRIAIVDLVPRVQPADGKAEPGVAVPHITFQADYHGLAPVSVAEFDVPAFIGNVCESHTREVLAKLAPHLD